MIPVVEVELLPVPDGVGECMIPVVEVELLPALDGIITVALNIWPKTPYLIAIFAAVVPPRDDKTASA